MKIPALILVAGLVVSSAVMAAEENWRPVNKSIGALLNEGWVIRHYAPSRLQGQGDETFILENNGRYIICSAATSYVPSTDSFFPTPLQAHVTSTCEAMN